MKDILKSCLPVVILCTFVIGCLYFFYPVIRYEYQQRTGDRQVVRIDRFTGETSRLSTTNGWEVIESTIPK